MICSPLVLDPEVAQALAKAGGPGAAFCAARTCIVLDGSNDAIAIGDPARRLRALRVPTTATLDAADIPAGVVMLYADLAGTEDAAAAVAALARFAAAQRDAEPRRALAVGAAISTADPAVLAQGAARCAVVEVGTGADPAEAQDYADEVIEGANAVRRAAPAVHVVASLSGDSPLAEAQAAVARIIPRVDGLHLRGSAKGSVELVAWLATEYGTPAPAGKETA